MHRVRVLVAALASALLVTAGAARAAEGDLARAREAYDRGVAADAAGDHGAAARAFAEADALAPSVASLEAALESAMRADDARLGGELLERAAGRPADAGLARTVEVARRRFSGRTGVLVVDCGARECLVSVDGVAREGRRVRELVGPHDVLVQRDGVGTRRLVRVEPDATVVISPDEPATPPPAREPPPAASRDRGGLPPLVFFVGVGATAALGGVTVVSAVDTVRFHDRFVADGCAPGGTGPLAASCEARADDGRDRQLRTNLLLGGTAVLAVASAVVGALFVRWSDEPGALRATAFATAGGGGAAVEGRLP